MKVLLKSTQIIDQILPKTLKYARKWTLIKDTNPQIRLLEKWGKALEDGPRKNTKSFYRGWNCSAGIGRRLSSMLKHALEHRSEAMRRNTFCEGEPRDLTSSLKQIHLQNPLSVNKANIIKKRLLRFTNYPPKPQFKAPHSRRFQSVLESLMKRKTLFSGLKTFIWQDMKQ